MGGGEDGQVQLPGGQAAEASLVSHTQPEELSSLVTVERGQGQHTIDDEALQRPCTRQGNEQDTGGAHALQVDHHLPKAHALRLVHCAREGQRQRQLDARQLSARRFSLRIPHSGVYPGGVAGGHWRREGLPRLPCTGACT